MNYDANTMGLSSTWVDLLSFAGAVGAELFRLRHLDLQPDQHRRHGIVRLVSLIDFEAAAASEHAKCKSSLLGEGLQGRAWQ